MLGGAKATLDERGGPSKNFLTIKCSERLSVPFPEIYQREFLLLKGITLNGMV
jgi:hypothetical protein